MDAGDTAMNGTREGDRTPAMVATDNEEIIGGEVAIKMEAGEPLKLARSAVRKVEKRSPKLCWDYEDKTAEATSTFSTLTECVYANKQMGTTEHALECDCAEEWDPVDEQNYACGEDSDCINRATKMECVGDCGCGSDCQNQRFQRKEYAKVSVIKTEKKGYGLRVEKDLKPHEFIYEYIGEVIGENVFRRRMQQYDEEGIKHFYFMSLNKGEFVDATKRGNLGRFCNHSCNPNCYVDKWVVGDRLRMGIFAERKIKAGEELVFNYNVDRYGADPQPCYCGEPNCSGYIGGKTQTGGAIKLSHTMIEALGIEDAEALDAAAARRPRKKKIGEEDEEYVNKFEPRGLDEEGVNKVMSSLMQCKEKWIAIKLLARIQRAEDERVWNRVVRFHGYRIMKTVLSNFSDDVNVCLQVLDVLEKMPRLTRNKIQDSKIEEAIEPMLHNDEPRVAAQASLLMDVWSQLEVGYRIPRVKRDPAANTAKRKTERRDVEQRPSPSRSKSPERIVAPTGPRNKVASRPPFRPKPLPSKAQPRPAPPDSIDSPTGPLPPGWFEATTRSGQTYYYNRAGKAVWQRPTKRAVTGGEEEEETRLTDKTSTAQRQHFLRLIDQIVATKTEPVRSSSASATPAENVRVERSGDKWRSLSEEKRKKVYEGAIQPHIMHVVNKYKQRLPKDDLKRWARELAKKMVDSDFRKGRVEHGAKLSEKQIKNIKKHAQEFFEKAAKKKAEADGKRDVPSISQPRAGPAQNVGPMAADAVTSTPADGDDDVALSDAPSPGDSTSLAPSKRTIDEVNEGGLDGDEDVADVKRPRTESVDGMEDILQDESAGASPPPPPPPPPPNVGDGFDEDAFTPDTSSFATHGTPAVQTATPPTTGSPDEDEVEKDAADNRFVNGVASSGVSYINVVNGSRG